MLVHTIYKHIIYLNRIITHKHGSILLHNNNKSNTWIYCRYSLESTSPKIRNFT